MKSILIIILAIVIQFNGWNKWISWGKVEEYFQISAFGATDSTSYALAANYTYINLAKPAEKDGQIEKVVFILHNAQTNAEHWFGSFSRNGDYFTLIDSTKVTVSGADGQRIEVTLDDPIKINKGNYLGWYSPANQVKRSSDGSGGGMYYRAGNIAWSGTAILLYVLETPNDDSGSFKAFAK